jgi:uncharacterized protein (DUF1786 family)
LAVDIGGGTQDILLYDESKALENCIQMVLPSPTRLVAAKIARATSANKSLFLTGGVMGGGPSVRAVREHLARGLAVVATPKAALTIHDDPNRVEALGIRIGSEPPAGSEVVELHDVDLAMYKRLLDEVGEYLPAGFAVAVQDHGYSPYESNRVFRFRLWEQFMASGGKLNDLAYKDVPAALTRMQSVKETVPKALLMDTCGAAVLGALCDPRVKAAAHSSGVVIINIGNQHTFAAIVQGERILGLFEHHTNAVTQQKLVSYLERLLAGTLTNKEVFDDNGHGCVPPQEKIKPALTTVTGPRRSLLWGNDYYLAAPQGNMMLMGCFGLAAALKEQRQA